MSTGVVVTHGMFAAAIHTLRFGAYMSKSMLSYLPLSHIYEVTSFNCCINNQFSWLHFDIFNQRLLEYSAILYKTGIGYSTGDPLRLLEDAQILKPDSFPMVPRVLNRIYQLISLAAKEQSVKGYLLRTALDTKLRNYRADGSLKHAFWDRVVLSKVGGLRILGWGFVGWCFCVFR